MNLNGSRSDSVVLCIHLCIQCRCILYFGCFHRLQVSQSGRKLKGRGIMVSVHVHVHNNRDTVCACITMLHLLEGLYLNADLMKHKLHVHVHVHCTCSCT